MKKIFHSVAYFSSLLILMFFSLMTPWMWLHAQTQDAQPSVADFCNKSLETIPVQSGGRVKPLYVLAKESAEFLFVAVPANFSVTQLFCQLSLQSIGLPPVPGLLIKVDHPDVRKFLQLPEAAKGMAPQDLEAQSNNLKIEMVKTKEFNSYKKELQKVMMRLSTYQEIISGNSWTIPQWDQEQLTWAPIAQGLNESALQKLMSKAEALKTSPLQLFFTQYTEKYEEQFGKKHYLEFYYFKLHPYTWALLLSLIAILTLFLFAKSRISFSFIGLSLALQLSAIICRIIISGRAPITNMYETVLFSGFGAALFSLGFYLYKREKIYLAAGLGYNILCLMMMNFANNMLSPSINPLVPVLRDNFWLSTHVTTVILSYATLALSWMLANLVILQRLTGKKIFSHYQTSSMTPLIYNCVKVGAVMLVTGIILGGVWADYSWGRFWGWDPKETWSLIVFLIYMAILHGKYTSWITPERFIPLVALAFLSVMMAWFGVNYILASGLHSYGFSEGGAIFLASFFLVQMSILGIYFVKFKKVLIKKL